MIKDFGYEEPSKISELSTIVMTSFAFGQTLTAVSWGRFSDKYGRKPALMIGSFGTLVMTVFFGLSRNIYMAIAARLCCGLLNGNVGVMRTMVAEIVGNRREHQTRAFALLPMAMNIGTIVGPIIGGMLANPVEQFPGLFKDNRLFAAFPYLLPNLVPVPMSLASVCLIALFIKETGDSRHTVLRVETDPMLKMGNALKSWFIRAEAEKSETEDEEEPLLQNQQDDEESATEDSSAESDAYEHASLRSILTKPVRVTLVCHVLLMLHCPAFMQLLPLLLATPRIEQEWRNAVVFNGGLGLPTSRIGVIIAILAIMSIVLQIAVYPTVATKLGNALTHRMALFAFPIGYTLIPYLSFLPKDNDNLAIIASTILSSLCVVGRTFAIPPMTVLMTNASPSRKVLGTVHGLTHSATSAARCVGPFLLGNIYSLGVKVGIIGLAWWIMSLTAIIEIFSAVQLKEWGQ
ncbi:hypothetical protein TRICI_003067 [Trichomonascus ciferrii]|uniref:Major facilitator superfamily (MFS) profile domain-containing protein n=1 Tax=Trichomonascus ciferrii TaxID=44093 RepID=A0A642VA06_9ASCO|nr:hypothetical protein TRICI_003067 [Trichomonascus ciferrii]